MLSRLRGGAARGLLPAAARTGAAAWLPLACVAARGLATRVSRGLVFDHHGDPERVLRLEDSVLPLELGEHEVLINLLAVRAVGWWPRCGSGECCGGSP